MKASKLLNPVSMLAAGLLLGVMTRMFDIYCQNLGEVFMNESGDYYDWTSGKEYLELFSAHMTDLRTGNPHGGTE